MPPVSPSAATWPPSVSLTSLHHVFDKNKDFNVEVKTKNQWPGAPLPKPVLYSGGAHILKGRVEIHSIIANSYDSLIKAHAHLTNFQSADGNSRPTVVGVKIPNMFE